MVWFKVDDALAMHLKTFNAGNAAMGLWVRAGSWSAQQLSDGVIPREVVAALGGAWDDATALVNAGLWEVTEAGYRFHDWAEYQPTREQVEAERGAARDRMRERRRNNRGQFGERSAEHTANVRENFDVRSSTPTRPDQEPSEEGSAVARTRANGSRIPEPFILTAKMREWAAAEYGAIDVDGITAQFVDYWRGKAGAGARKADWAATWRNWVRRDAALVKPTPTQRAARTVQAGRVVAGQQITTLEIES